MVPPDCKPAAGAIPEAHAVEIVQLIQQWIHATYGQAHDFVLVIHRADIHTVQRVGTLPHDLADSLLNNTLQRDGERVINVSIN